MFSKVSLPERTLHRVAIRDDSQVVGVLGIDRRECRIASFKAAFDEGFLWYFTQQKMGR